MDPGREPPPENVPPGGRKAWQDRSQEANRRLDEAASEVYDRQRQAAAYAEEQRLQAAAEADAFLKRLAQYRELASRDPDAINALWLDEMGRIYTAMRDAGRIEMLDHYLGREGVSSTQFPLQPKKR